MQHQYISYVMKKIFQMSDLSIIRMLNHLFGKNYTDHQNVIKYWGDGDIFRISIIIGGTDRYTCYVPYFDSVPQLYIRDDGYVFYRRDAVSQSVLSKYSHQSVFFGENRKEEYVTTLDFIEHEQVVLAIHMYILMDCSARQLEKEGLILFLPLLFCSLKAKDQNSEIKRGVLKYFIFHDIVGALHDSMKKGDISVYDVEKLKQLCGYMAWKMLLDVKWMQSLELQELLMEAFCTDIELLERTHQRELDNIRNK